MMRKCVVLLLVLSMLLGCAAPVQATGLTREVQYEAALTELNKYFDGEATVTLENLSQLFEDLGVFRRSVTLGMYVNVLRDIEAGEYGMIFFWLQLMHEDEEFGLFLEEQELPSLEALSFYAEGRIAESSGNLTDAVAFYRQSTEIPDSMMRIQLLWADMLKQQYEEAKAWFEQDTPQGYQKASELFGELAQMRYLDSAAMKEKADTKIGPPATQVPAAVKKPVVTAAPAEKESPVSSGRAEITVTASKDVAYLEDWNSYPGDTGCGYRADFYFENHSDVPFTPEYLHAKYYWNDKLDCEIYVEYQTIRNAMHSDKLYKENDPLEWGFGTDRLHLTHLEVTIRGTDDNGNVIEASTQIQYRMEYAPSTVR